MSEEVSKPKCAECGKLDGWHTLTCSEIEQLSAIETRQSGTIEFTMQSTVEVRAPQVKP